MNKRPLLWILGAFIIICMLQWKNETSFDAVFLDEINAQVTGNVEKIEQKESGISYLLKDITIKPNGLNTFYCNKIIVYYKESSLMKVGNLVTLSGKIYKFKKPTNPGQFNEKQYYKSKQIDYKMMAENLTIIDDKTSHIRGVLQFFREKLMATYQCILNEKDAGIIDAMLLGEDNLLDENVQELYRKSGISHVLVISGLTISFLGLALYQLLIRAGVPIVPNSIITIVIIFYYGLMTDFGVSTNRAVVMFALALIAKLIGRTYDMKSAMALSAILILIQSPGQIFHCGFLLSFAAILGIAYIAPVFRSKIKDPVKRSHYVYPAYYLLKEGIIITLSINLITTPILLYYFYEIPLYGVLVNLFILPFLSILVILAMLGGILGCVYLPMGKFLMGGVHIILTYIDFICNVIVGFPYSTLVIGRPHMIQIFFYYFILIIVLIVFTIYHKKRVWLLLSLLLTIFIHFDDHNLQITMLDVGQGDGIVIETPKEQVYLIDGGSTSIKGVGTYRIEPYLKYNGIRKIDAVFVTHGDEDHISGIMEILQNNRIKIKTLMIPDVPLEESGLLELCTLAIEKGTSVMRMNKGDRIKKDDLQITCLHPEINFRSESRNSYSTVLYFEYGLFQGLFTGDLEEDAEKLLLDVKSCYLLKVAHHGSKNSTGSEFLNRVKPKLSIISCGKKNRYGHPHQELIERLSIAGSSILITKDHGAITIKTDGKSVSKDCFNKH